jgi:Activator of Hsp90 ATPase homolog 1-like protein
VFAALTRPELLGRWLGARGWQVVDCEIDLRVGGTWRVLSRGPGGAQMAHGGVYREVAAPRPGRLHGGLRRSVVRRRGARHRRARRDRPPDHPHHHDAVRLPRDPGRVLATPMRRGVAQGYDRLDAVLADLPPTVPAQQTERAHHAGHVHQTGKSPEEQAR